MELIKIYYIKDAFKLHLELHSPNLLQDMIKSQKSVSKMLAKVRNLTRHLHQSTSDAEVFKSLQATSTPLVLIQDVVTRFDSTYLMAQRCLCLEDTVQLYLSKHPLKGIM